MKRRIAFCSLILAMVLASSTQAKHYESFAEAIQDIQANGDDTTYLPVSIPEYGGKRGVFTQSRLYRDRIIFIADTQLRGSQQWTTLVGLGWVKNEQYGTGIVYEYDKLNPCSDMKSVGEKHLPTLRVEQTRRICLEGNRLNAVETVYAEFVGGSNDAMIAAGICRRGKWGGCILMTEKEPFVWSVVPR
jgi:hypothetical protein